VSVRTIGRYEIHGEIASGGMATVHFGRLTGPASFSRPVALKQLHAHFARDPDFVEMFLDEARVASRIQHPNVAATLDVINEGDALVLVLEYVPGESLARLLRQTRMRKERVSPRIAAAIAVAVLHGLHAAHEARSPQGEPLNVVHRDVSPQNVLVGIDGVVRVIDFGVAKAAGRAQSTAAGHVKGKLAYMAPEQLRGAVTPKTDIFATSIVLWETLTAQRLFKGEHEGEILENVNKQPIVPPKHILPEIPEALDEIVMRGLERDPDKRWPTAKEMARAIESAVPLATPSEISAWVNELAGDVIRGRAERIAELESNPAHFVRDIEPRAPEVETSPLHAVVSQEPEPPARRRWVPFVAIGAVLAIGVGVFVVRMNRAEPVEVRPAASSAPSPSVVVTAAPSPSISVSAVDSGLTPAASPSVAKPKLAPVIKKDSCDPPYVRAANGKLVPKPGCL
jgi:eukaryotic-like serine/threonine-protein kinase